MYVVVVVGGVMVVVYRRVANSHVPAASSLNEEREVSSLASSFTPGVTQAAKAPRPGHCLVLVHVVVDVGITGMGGA